MLSMLRLNVKYRTDKEPVQMEFKQDALIRDVVMIASKYDLPLHYPYVIFNPQVDPANPQGWIRPDSETTLHSSYLKTGDSIELLCEPSNLNIVNLPEKEKIDLSKITLALLNSFKKVATVDFSEPIYKMIPTWMKYFPIKKKKRNYCALKVQLTDSSATITGMLNINLSPAEANLSVNGYVLLVPLDFFNRPASGIVNPIYQGHMDMKIKKGVGKYTKTKKYWFVQKYNLLYFYNSKTSTVAEGIIDLEYMSVRNINLEIHLSPATFLYLNLLAPMNDYVLEPEAHQFKLIQRRVLRHSASGAGKHQFGVSLTHLWDRKFTPDLPYVATACIEYINKYGINTEGVLQQSGRKEEVENLKDLFDKGDYVDLDTLRPSPHSVGEVLKVYLNELPEPLLSYGLYNDFYKARHNPGNLLMVLSQLPSASQLFIKYLTVFFLSFIRHAAANHITLHALASSFAFYFMRTKELTLEDPTVASSILATLIANCESYNPMPRAKSAKFFLQQFRVEETAPMSPPFPLDRSGSYNQFTPLNLTPPPTPPTPTLRNGRLNFPDSAPPSPALSSLSSSQNMPAPPSPVVNRMSTANLVPPPPSPGMTLRSSLATSSSNSNLSSPPPPPSISHQASSSSLSLSQPQSQPAPPPPLSSLPSHPTLPRPTFVAPPPIVPPPTILPPPPIEVPVGNAGNPGTSADPTTPGGNATYAAAAEAARAANVAASAAAAAMAAIAALDSTLPPLPLNLPPLPLNLPPLPLNLPPPPQADLPPPPKAPLPPPPTPAPATTTTITADEPVFEDTLGTPPPPPSFMSNDEFPLGTPPAPPPIPI